MAKLGYSTFCPYFQENWECTTSLSDWAYSIALIYSPLFQIRNTCTSKNVQLIWYIFINLVMKTNDMNERIYCYREEKNTQQPYNRCRTVWELGKMAIWSIAIFHFLFNKEEKEGYSWLFHSKDINESAESEFFCTSKDPEAIFQKCTEEFMSYKTHF